MSIEKDLQDAFEAFKGRRDGLETFAADVISINHEKGTCTVKEDEIEYADVRLSSVINVRDSSHYIFPVIGSSVLVAPINEDINQLYVEAYSEIKSLESQIENTKYKMTSSGFHLERNGQSLKQILNDFIDEVNKIIVVQGTTINQAAVVAIKERLNEVLF